MPECGRIEASALDLDSSFVIRHSSLPAPLAWFLASYARDAKARIEQRLDLPALAAVRTALEEALGLEFQGDKGEHFFRSSLIQTLFYGVFSAWVLWARKLSHDDRGKLFDWRMAAWSLHVPMVRALFDQVATPHQLQPLGLVEVLDWAAAASRRTINAAACFRPSVLGVRGRGGSRTAPTSARRP